MKNAKIVLIVTFLLVSMLPFQLVKATDYYEYSATMGTYSFGLSYSDAVYATARNASTAEGSSSALKIGQNFDAGSYYIYRSTLYFTVPSLTGEITDAYFSFYGYDTNDNATNFEIVARFDSTQTHPETSAPYTDDWDLDFYDTTAATVNVNYIANGAHTNVTINAAGIELLEANEGATVAFFLTSNHDLTNTAPTDSEYVTLGYFLEAEKVKLYILTEDNTPEPPEESPYVWVDECETLTNVTVYGSGVSVSINEGLQVNGTGCLQIDFTDPTTADYVEIELNTTHTNYPGSLTMLYYLNWWAKTDIFTGVTFQVIYGAENTYYNLTMLNQATYSLWVQNSGGGYTTYYPPSLLNYTADEWNMFTIWTGVTFPGSVLGNLLWLRMGNSTYYDTNTPSSIGAATSGQHTLRIFSDSTKTVFLDFISLTTTTEGVTDTTAVNTPFEYTFWWLVGGVITAFFVTSFTLWGLYGRKRR